MQGVESWPSFPFHLRKEKQYSLSLILLIHECIDCLEELHQYVHALSEGASKSILNEQLHTFFSKRFPHKLCFYFESLLKISKRKKHPSIELLNEIRIFQLKLNASNMQRTLTALYTRIKRLFLTLASFFEKVKSDENVLMSILEHRARLVDHLGSENVNAWIQKFFPNEKGSLRKILQKKFKQRGFLHFVEQNEHLFEKIERDAQWKLTSAYS